MRALRMLLVACLMSPAWAAAQQTDTVGGQGGDSTGSGSFKVTMFDVAQTVELDTFEFYMDPAANGTEVFFVLYQETGGGLSLVWDSGARAVNPGVDYKGAGAVGQILQAGERYGVGVYLPPGEDVTYFYGDVGGEDIGWATVDRAYWAQNGSIGDPTPPDPAFGNPSNSPYHLRIRVGFGEDLDGDGAGFGDCDDTDPTVYPGAIEACDEVDNDCDGQVDEDVIYRDVFPDADGDGFGNPDGEPMNICEAEAPAGYANELGDCDDSRADVNPDATEVCDGVDNNCDGQLLAEEDLDGDLDGVPVCSDCDDTNADVFPGRTSDPCNGRDNDCDGEIPEGKECDPLENGEDLVIGSACACDSGTGGGLAWLAVLGLVAVRRRRS